MSSPPASGEQQATKSRCLPLPFMKKKKKEQQSVSDLPVPDVFLPIEDGFEIDNPLVKDLANIPKLFDDQKKEKLETKVRSARKRNNAFTNLWIEIQKNPGGKNVDDEIQNCFESLVPCLSAIKALGKDRKQFINVLFLTQVAVKLVTSVYLGLVINGIKLQDDVTLDVRKAGLIKLMKQIRSHVKAPLKNADLPVSSLNLSLSRLEIGIKAIPNKGEGKQALMAGAKAIFGAAKAVAEMKLNDTFTEGVAGLAKLGVEKVIQKQADQVFRSVARYEYFAAYVQVEMFGPVAVAKSKDEKNTGKSEGEKIKGLTTTLKELETDALKESRWEVLASFVDVLASVVLGDGTGKKDKTIHAVNANFLRWVVEGDESFLGLMGLASFGEDPPIKDRLESGSDVPLFALDRWASNVFEGVRGGLDGKSVRDGVELVQSQIEIGLQSLQDQVLQFLESVSDLVEKELALAAQQPFRIAKQQFQKSLKANQNDIEALLDDTLKKLNMAKGGLVKAGRAVDGMKAIISKLIDVLSKAVQVADQGSQFLSKLNKFFGSDNIMAVFQQELEEDVKMMQSSFWDELSKLARQKHVLPFQDRDKPFEEVSQVEEYFEGYSLVPISDVLDAVMRAMSAYTAVQALANPQEAEEGKFDNALKTVSEFRMLVQTQKGFIEASKESLRNINKGVDKKERELLQKELASLVSEHAKSNFEASKTKFAEVRDLLIQSFPTSGAPSSPPSHNRKAKLEEKSVQESLGLVTFRLQAVTKTLNTVIQRAKNLQTVFLEGSDALKSAQGKAVDCVSVVEKFKANPQGAAVNAESVLKEFRSLHFRLFGQKEAAEPSGPGGDAAENTRSMVAMLSEMVGRGVALMSDCSWMMVSCNNITKHPNTKLSFDIRLPSVVGDVQDLTKELQKVKEEMSQQAAQVVGETWGVVSQNLDQAVEEYEEELEAVSGVLRGAFDFGRGLMEMVKGESASRSRKELWRVRDRALYQLMAVRASLRMKPPTSSTGEDASASEASDPQDTDEENELEKLQKAVDQTIVRRRAMEQVPGIRRTLQSETFMQAMTDVVKEGVQDGEGKLKEEIDERLQTVIELEDKLLAETDAVKKQAGLIALHREKAALNKVMENVQDMNTHFKVLRTTLDQMTKQLEVINAKLDQLTDLVKDLQQDIRRLVGLPPLYVLDQYRLELLAKGFKMRNEVYIPLVATKTNESLMDVAHRFLNNATKGCMLVSGRAGSGKSVFATKLEQYILGAYYDKRFEEDKKKVVLIWANLPALKNPLTGLFEEALQKYHFLPDQVRRLREEIQNEDSEVEAVFVLDGYDELRPEYLWRNLYKTNNLESYRPTKDSDTPEGQALFAFPKVFILCRQELLSTNQDGDAVDNAFLPLESLNQRKDEPHEARHYFEKVEIALLGSDKFEEYTREYVALNVRSVFQEQFPHYNFEAQAKDWEDPCLLEHLVQEVQGNEKSGDAAESQDKEKKAPDDTAASRDDAGGAIERGFGWGNMNEKPKPGLYYSSSEYESYWGDRVKEDTSSSALKGDDSEIGLSLDFMGESEEPEEDSMRASSRARDEMNNPAFERFQISADDKTRKWELEELDRRIGKLFDDDDDAQNGQAVIAARDQSVKNQLKALAKSLAAPLKVPPSDSDTVSGLSALRNKLSEYVQNKKTELTSQPGTPHQEPASGTRSGAGVGNGTSNENTNTNNDEVGDKKAMWVTDPSDTSEDFRLMFRFLHGVSKAPTEKVQEDEDKFLQELTNRKLWSAEQIVHEYKELPELTELTKTPFMIQIVVKILPMLKDLKATLSSVKEDLILRLTESKADVAWAALQQQKLVHNDKALAVLQRLMDLVDNAKKKLRDNQGSQQLQASREEALQFLRTQITRILEDVAQQIVETPNPMGEDSEEAENQTLSSERIQQALTRALKRKPVRRFLIYNEFMKNFVEQEQARLASRAGNIAPNQMRKEFWEYSQRLAVKMTGDVLTKVTYHPRSVIFSDSASDEWHPFFGSGDKMRHHREEVRRVAPLKSQNDTHSFLHKSVQEYFVAMAVCDSVTQLVKQSLIPSPAKLFDQIRAAKAQILTSSHSVHTPKTRDLPDMEDDLDLSAEELALKDIQDALDPKNTGSKAAERKRQAKAILKLIQGLSEGPLNTIDLSGEEAVRDFLLDTLLDNIQVASAFGAVASLCLTESLHKGKLRFVAENLRLLFTAPMPKREHNTLLHIACQPDESNPILLNMVLEFCLDKDYCAKYRWDWGLVLLAKNKDGHSPLMVALNSKNWEMSTMLLEHCNSESMKEELMRNCETRKSELTALDQKGGETPKFMFKSGEKMFVTSGKSYFQVEVNLSELSILAMDDSDDMLGFGGSICVGFAAGTPPTCEKVADHFGKSFFPSSNQSGASKKEKTGGHAKDLKLAKELLEGATKAGAGDANADPSAKGQKAKWLETKLTEWTSATNRRLKTCPLGGSNTQGFHNVTGIALHVVEPFESVIQRQKRLEVHCEKILFPMPEEEEVRKQAIGNSRIAVPLFPAKAGVAAQGGGGNAGTPAAKPPQASRQNQGGDDDGNNVLVLDKAKLKDTSAYLGVAIDFQTEDQHEMIVRCCWWTKSSPGEWQEVARVPKVDGPFFPVVCAWGLLCRPVIDLGDRQDGFKIGAPGGDEVGFQHYMKAVRGVPGHYQMARQGEWDTFFKLVKQVEVDQRFGLLSCLDPNNGMTLLHSLVDTKSPKERKLLSVQDQVEKMLKGASACLTAADQPTAGGRGPQVEDVLLAKDAKGYSAFSLVTDKGVAKSIMRHVSDIDAKGQMMTDLVNRLYKETIWVKDEGDLEPAVRALFVNRVSVFRSTLNWLKKEHEKLQRKYYLEETETRSEEEESDEDSDQGNEDSDTTAEKREIIQKIERFDLGVLGTLLRKARKVRENRVFFECVIEGMAEEDDADKSAQQDEVASEKNSEPSGSKAGQEEVPSRASDAGGSSRAGAGSAHEESEARPEAGADTDESEHDNEQEDNEHGDLIGFFILPLLGHKGMELLSPAMKQDPDVVKLAVRSDPRSLKDSEVPDEIRRDMKFLELAVQYDGLALKYSDVSKEEPLFRDIAVCAVSQNPRALEHAPVLSGDECVVLAAVEENGMTLEYASQQLQSSKRVVEAAVKQNCMALRFVDWEVLRAKSETAARKIAMDAVKEDGMALAWVPEAMRKDPELVQLALQRSGQAIRYAPEEIHQNEDIVKTALKSDPQALLFVDKTHAENLELVLSLLEDNPQVLRHLDDKMLSNKQVQTQALLKHPEAVFDIVKELDMQDDIESEMGKLQDSSPQACWSCAVCKLLADTAKDERKPFVTQCAWLLRGLDYELDLESDLEIPPLNDEYAKLVAAAAEWREGKEHGAGGAMDMSTCWLFLVRCYGLELEIEISERGGDMDQEDLERKEAVQQLAKASIESGGKDGELLQFASEKQQKSEDFVLKAIMTSEGGAFKHAKELHSNVAIVEAALDLDPMNLEYVQKMKMNPAPGSDEASADYREKYKELALKAVEANAMALEFVNREFLPSPELEAMADIVTKAVRLNGMALVHDPQKATNALSCMLAMAMTWRAIEHVPEAVKRMEVEGEHGETLRFYDFAVSCHGRALEHLPEAAKEDKAVVLAAVKKDGTALQFASAKLREDHEVCSAAVQQSGLALQFVESEDFINHKTNSEMIKKAVKEHGSMLEYGPFDLCEDEEVAMEAIKSDILALQFVLADIEPNTLTDLLKESIQNQRRYQFEIAASANHSVDIDHGNRTIDFKDDMATVVCPRMMAVRGCRLYYEVKIVALAADRDNVWMQFGFADQTFKPKVSMDGDSSGVGDMEGSWGIDGFRRCFFANEDWLDWGDNNRPEVEGARPPRKPTRKRRDDKIALMKSIMSVWPGDDDAYDGGDGGDDKDSGGDDNDDSESGGDGGDDKDSGGDDNDDSESGHSDDDGDMNAEFRVGTVLGMLCDPKRGTISFWANGRFIAHEEMKDYRNAFEEVEFTGPGLFIALSGGGLKIEYNLGEPDRDGQLFQFSDNPLRRTHNMDEWFFKSNEEDASKDVESRDAAMKIAVLDNLAKQAKKAFVDAGVEEVSRKLDLSLLDEPEAPEKVVSSVVELKCNQDEFRGEVEEKFRGAVAEQAKVDVEKVSVNHWERSRDGVEVGFSVTVPSRRAEKVVAGLTLAKLNAKLKEWGQSTVTSVKVAAAVEELPPTITAIAATRASVPPPLSNFTDVASSFPDMDTVTKELPATRYQRSSVPAHTLVPLSPDLHKILSGTHVGLSYEPYTAPPIGSVVVAAPGAFSSELAASPPATRLQPGGTPQGGSLPQAPHSASSSQDLSPIVRAKHISPVVLRAAPPASLSSRLSPPTSSLECVPLKRPGSAAKAPGSSAAAPLQASTPAIVTTTTLSGGDGRPSAALEALFPTMVSTPQPSKAALPVQWQWQQPAFSAPQSQPVFSAPVGAAAFGAPGSVTAEEVEAARLRFEMLQMKRENEALREENLSLRYPASPSPSAAAASPARRILGIDAAATDPTAADSALDWFSPASIASPAASPAPTSHSRAAPLRYALPGQSPGTFTARSPVQTVQWPPPSPQAGQSTAAARFSPPGQVTQPSSLPSSVFAFSVSNSATAPIPVGSPSRSGGPPRSGSTAGRTVRSIV